ncbi:MAG: AIR synthase related protein [Bacteroidales bacterium]|nr:AIR synthase related protein [Bacteroidales bacterium]MDY2935218.1 AIR synthase related protein [Candidatus Cryptobacteroides sp.]
MSMSSEDSFSSLGKIEAINNLLSSAGLKRESSFSPTNGSLVKSAGRIFLEGIDFDLIYFPLPHLGYKCVVAVTGEIFAALAHPRLLQVRLGVSSKLDYKNIQELFKGIVAAAKEFGYSSMDLDLAPSPNGLTIGISAVGEELKSTEERRRRANSKDLICISGSLGAAFLGQMILERGKKNFERDSSQPDLERYKMLVGSYLKPELNASILSNFEDDDIIPSNVYLVSHGLGDAVKRLVRDTGLGAKVYAGKIPFEGNSFDTGKELDIDPISAAMNGGDDFKLLFTIPILSAEKFRRDFQTFEIIGHLAQSDVGSVLVTPDGLEHPITAQGWPQEAE